MMQILETPRGDVAVFKSALYQTNSVVLKTPEVVFVIDPCWLPDEIARIREYVLSIQGSRSIKLIFTHSDYDHIIGRGAFPEARVIASKAFHNKADKQKDVRDALKWDAEHYIKRPYPIEYPIVDTVIDKDGKSLHYSGNVLTFYLAPGHTAEGIMIVYEPAGVLIAGDYLSDVEFPLIEDSLSKYQRTMAKIDRILRSHQIAFMVPGHGSIARSAKEIKHRQDDALNYIKDLQDETLDPRTFEEQNARKYAFWEGMVSTHRAQALRFGGNSRVDQSTA